MVRDWVLQRGAKVTSVLKHGVHHEELTIMVLVMVLIMVLVIVLVMVLVMVLVLVLVMK